MPQLPRHRARHWPAVLMLMTCLACGADLLAPSLARADPPSVLPIPGAVLRRFDPPAQPWQPGHRGVDLAGSAGESVLSAAAGRVSFVGTINGVTSVSVFHRDGKRTTYQPVEPTVAQGQQVSAGQPLGRLLPGHCAQACLHWGLLDGESYLDPLAWSGSSAPAGPIRLLPLAITIRPPLALDEAPRADHSTGEAPRADHFTGLPAPATGSSGAAMTPVAGQVSSRFGYRINPVRGTSELHDGIDFAAPCGTPVRAAWSGIVGFAGTVNGFGNRVVIDHRFATGEALSSSYSHLLDAGVGLIRTGQSVSAGQIIALVGTTGLSTGCHLHFSVHRQGVAIDPQPWLSWAP